MQAFLNAPASAVQQKTDHRSGKYIAFRPGSEEFAIQVLQVRESLAIQEITAVPQTPHGVKGVINLRGKVIPVVDRRLRFGFQELEHSPRTCIIVVQMNGGAGVALPICPAWPMLKGKVKFRWISKRRSPRASWQRSRRRR